MLEIASDIALEICVARGGAEERGEMPSGGDAEDADVIGLSVMTGGHIHISQEVVDKLKEQGADDIKVVMGGVIPKRDIAALEEIGVDGVFPGGTPIDDAIEWIKANVN